MTRGVYQPRRLQTIGPAKQRLFREPVRGKCRSCGCTEKRACPGGCAWSDRSKTHCDGCFCARCQRKFITVGQWEYAEIAGELVRVCRRAECKEANGG